MRIGFYIPQLTRGGAERVIVNLAKQFVANGHQVSIITTIRLANEYIVPDGVERFVLNEPSIKGTMATFKRNRRLRLICKKKKLDILVSFIGGANFQAIIGTFGLRTKTIISVRNDPEFEYAGKMNHILAKVLLPFANGCVFQTPDARSWFPKRLQKKSKIIFNAVAEEFYNKNRDEKNNLVVTCGRLSPQKNQRLLIAAFKSVVELIPDAMLYIYGDGALRHELEDYIVREQLEENVFLKGNTTNVPDVLANAMIFVLPSDFEGMPNALMEAMAMGIPSIATDCPCGGPRMLLENNENGMLVSINNKEELKESIVYLLNNKEIRERLSNNAKEVAEKFRANTIFDQWDSYISNVLKG